MQIAIVGAGLAGLACATCLQAGGHATTLFDKGRGPGGRMSARRVATPFGEVSFDHGAQYFTARDPAFMAQVGAWAASGVAARWPAAGPDAWVGTPAMNGPVKALAASLDVHWGKTVTALSQVEAGWRITGDGIEPAAYDVALVAIPAEQAGRLLAGARPDWSGRAAANPAAPCWTVMATFASRIPVGPDVMTEDGPVGWAARNSAKPGRAGPEAWVIQAGPDWSRAQLEQTPDTIVPELLTAFGDRVGAALPPVLTASAHRWRYAKSGREGSGALWDPAVRLGVCGDWLLGPRVECAWLSGVRLAAMVCSAGPEPGRDHVEFA